MLFRSSNVTTLDEILDKKYGKKGMPKREQWEQEFEAFRLGVLLEEARIKLGMTQEELAQKFKPPLFGNGEIVVKKKKREEI